MICSTLVSLWKFQYFLTPSVKQLWRSFYWKNSTLFFLQLEGEETLDCCWVYRPPSEKFNNIVAKDHGRTPKCNFCVSVCKINFTITHLIQYTVLEIQSWSVKCTTVTFPFLLIKRCKRFQWLDYMNENKPLVRNYYIR